MSGERGVCLREYPSKAGLWEGDFCLILNLCKSQSVNSIADSSYKTTLYCYWHNLTYSLTQKLQLTPCIHFTPVNVMMGAQVWERRKGSRVCDGVCLLLFLMPMAGCLHTLQNVKQVLCSARPSHGATFHPNQKWQMKSRSFQRKKWVLK